MLGLFKITLTCCKDQKILFTKSGLYLIAIQHTRNLNTEE